MYEKRKIKKMLKILRDNGKEKIMERVNLFKNKDSNLPNDILTNILESYSNLANTFIFDIIKYYN
jgi:hypothetical protein